MNKSTAPKGEQPSPGHSEFAQHQHPALAHP